MNHSLQTGNPEAHDGSPGRTGFEHPRPGTADRPAVEAGEGNRNPAVVFLCVHNAGRSQMAAAWTRHLGGDAVEVFSGGSNPATEVNPAAVAAMAEAGIDISVETPRPWTDEIVGAADVVVTMGCGDTCPVFPGVRYEDWELEDPARLPLERVRAIRDDIRDRVEDLLRRLGVG